MHVALAELPLKRTSSLLAYAATFPECTYRINQLQYGPYPQLQCASVLKSCNSPDCQAAENRPIL